MLTIISKVMIIFLMIAVGYLANKKSILPAHAEGPINAYVLNIACPCMILVSMASPSFDDSAKTDIIQVFVGSVVYFVVTIVFAYLVVKAMKYSPKEDWGVLVIMMSCMNLGFMGFPVTKSIFGNYFLFLIVIANIIFNVYLYIGVPIILRLGGPRRRNNRSYLRLLLQPNTIATAIGLILLFTQIKLPAIATEFLSTLGDSTIPLSMVMIGFQLAKESLSSLLVDKKFVLACATRMAIIPVMTFFAVNWLPLTTSAKVTLLFAASFPSAVMPATMAAEEGKNAGLMSAGIALTTLISVITLPLAAFFLMHWYGVG